MGESRLRALFQHTAATHLFAVSLSPLRVAAVQQTGFAAGATDGNLAALFGLARVLAERDRLQASVAAGEGAAACR